jgi:hypothetical protein
MASGEGVLIWKYRDKAGIYAIAEIIESPKIMALLILCMKMILHNNKILLSRKSQKKINKH